MLAGWARGLWREPLVRFGLSGALLFAVSTGYESSRGTEVPNDGSSDPTRVERPSDLPIVVPPTVATGPDRERWLDEEVLVRRARELQLDEVDLVIRRRLAQQMRFLVEDTHAPPEPDDAALSAWLAGHQERYQRPGRLELRHVFVSRGAHGQRLDEDARALLVQLRAGANAATLGDPFFAGSEFHDVSSAELSARFGAVFADAVTVLEVGPWEGPVASSYGLHLVRVERRSPPRPATLEEVRARVRLDVLAERQAEANRAALDDLRARYGVPPAETTPTPTVSEP